MKTKKNQSSIIVYLILFLFSILMLFPFIWMILSSFKFNADVVAVHFQFFPKNPTLSNYSDVWGTFNFAQFFKNSILLAVVKTAIILYTSSLVGYVLDKIEFKGRNVVFIFILSTMMIPWPVTIIPMYNIMVKFGWVGNYTALIVPSIFSGFGIFMMKQFSSSIPTELIEAARIEGASEIGIFHIIIFPLLGSALSALGIFQFLWNWEDFLWPYLMLNDEAKYTLPIGLAFFNGQYATNYAGILAAATITVIPVLIVYFIFQRRFIEGIAMTGLKG